ncbi:MAG: tripartite tricarboxylate transporter substrate-binding protein, partial [Sulfuricaulis sp.]|nr:tripartite tricarboxylate transporter substrate-binding protein [Sulfuricaulis sp.]
MRIDKRREHESMPIRPVLLAAAIALGSLLVPFTGHAQYPSRPIKLIVSSAAGSGPDVIARSVAARLSPLLGQPIVIESHAGANGNIAVDLVAKSPAD